MYLEALQVPKRKAMDLEYHASLISGAWDLVHCNLKMGSYLNYNHDVDGI